MEKEIQEIKAMLQKLLDMENQDEMEEETEDQDASMELRKKAFK